MGVIVYNATNLKQVDSQTENFEYDLLITSGGSDYRAYELLRIADKKSYSFKKIILFHFENRLGKLEGESLKKYNYYKKFDFSFTEIKTSLFHPPECREKLESEIKGINPSSKVAIDISCFTKPFFFFLIKYFKKAKRLDKLTIFYTEPKSYTFSDGLFKSYQSSTGPIQIQEIPGFTGSSIRKLKSILIILLGFDGDLSKEISEEVAPSNILIVNGFPSYSPKFKDISLISNEKLISNNRESINYSRANNPFETYNLLEKINRKYPKQTHINIAPLGTKPMALGACLFALHNPDVRIVYPMPESYKNATTEECSRSWSYELPLLDF